MGRTYLAVTNPYLRERALARHTVSWHTDPVTPEEEREARERGRAIADLRDHWGNAYEIDFGTGMFVAIRRDNGATVRRPTARELHDEMARDYTARPVPHSL
jgi:hypothetical protein